VKAANPIDAFIGEKLAEKGLSLAAPADKRTLIRRATFDLTGLPPTPDEVDAFLADNAPNAFAKVVDRLLRSPHYGEKWGRHWLDVARYSDSNGLDENIALGTAWRYRDYVVKSINADKPFDQFLTEQLAGDLLDSKRHPDAPRARHRHRLPQSRRQGPRRAGQGQARHGCDRRADRRHGPRLHGPDARLRALP
jgi:hypothetical protein